MGGRSKTSLIATISPSTINLDETVSTLDYAMRARNIQNHPETNQRISRTALIEQYQKEIMQLKNDLTAARTGSGVYLDEGNYREMIQESQKYRTQLTEKMNVIRNLESKINESNEKLNKLTMNWEEAAGNVELLRDEKVILEQNFKEEMAKKQKELLESTNKQQKLEITKKELLNEYKQTRYIENSLQHKVNYLYRASYHNAETTKHFHETYNNLHLKLINSLKLHVESSEISLKHGISNREALKSSLKEFYYSLSGLSEEMQKLIVSVLKLQDEQKSISQAAHTKVLEDLTNFQVESNLMFENMCESINNIKTVYIGTLQNKLLPIFTHLKESNDEMKNTVRLSIINLYFHCVLYYRS